MISYDIIQYDIDTWEKRRLGKTPAAAGLARGALGPNISARDPKAPEGARGVFGCASLPPTCISSVWISSFL